MGGLMINAHDAERVLVEQFSGIKNSNGLLLQRPSISVDTEIERLEKLIRKLDDELFDLKINDLGD